MYESEQRGGTSSTMRGSRRLICPTVALVCGLMAAVAMPAHGAPLDPQVCEQLQSTLDGLRRDGVEADMALGAAQAKATLSAERFDRIGVFIATEEQLNFRCGLGKQRIVLPTTVEGGEEEIPAPAEATVEGAAGTLPLPQRAPRPTTDAAAKLTVVPKTPAAAPEAPAATPKPPAAAAKRRPAKAKDSPPPAAKPAAPDNEPRKATKKKATKKVDDAYRPPPKQGSGS
jgi:hypothetical protein